MDAKGLFYKALEQVSGVFDKLSSADYSKPTPDTEWDVRKLAAHMLYELSWVPDLVEGKTIKEVGDTYEGDLLGDKPADNWQNAVDRAREAVDECPLDGTAHLSYGDYRNGEYLQQVGGDLLIHGWDLARALGMAYHMDPEIARTVYEGMAANKADWHGTGLFGEEVHVPENADAQTKLLALTGRDVNWQLP